MPLHILRGLGAIGFGLLLGFVGLIWVANLFGVADEHARQIARSSLRRWVEGREVSPGEMKQEPGFVLGRYISGIGFMLVGLFIIGGGIVYLITAPVE
ncbi:hypothetical protein [Micromonospora narathiwatensis]|uniref:Uncharacterized protein n=1 Tax=Micromonospora narathiwatensis TaxID=299146 RepID=A0A1A9ADT5_9ACTN|nr:hypothetical protein [Micromonospora narathiwatensis]SBT54271.1 hypothetical protein GA0070621_5298 [Micromonospora narathiwatensis]